ncbi:DUF7619 domain-containing protein [Pontibacter harenae]|uniref:DUF7619 domain-containing protein n=1 Tax=Pontibacter harenae TaxID=2894083 RepID=UPI001E3BC0C2|nr:T9SS type A sorting domain-containing protein [Pontibacter harenae]MCC9168048.1 T9SS type A sorting domain-containing protein [Pontibacter harenae]
MKQLILILFLPVLCLCLWSGSVQAQFADNIVSIGGSYNDHVIKVLHDKDENRYVLGVIGMPGSVQIPGYQAEQIDFGTIKKEILNGFVAKYNKDNQCVWVKESPVALSNSFNDIAVENAGFTYITGGVHYGTFILEKLDPNGNLVWEKKYKSKKIFRDFIGQSIAVDKQGNVYVVGSFDGTAMDGITFEFDDSGDYPYTEFLAKFSPEGEVLWVKTSLERNINYTDVLIDSDGNVITAGGFSGTINISGHTLTNNTPADDYGLVRDRFFVKRDSDGNVIWAKSYPLRTGTSNDVVLDTDNNIYFISKAFFGDAKSVTINGVLIDRSFKETLVKLDDTGIVKWGVGFQGSIANPKLMYANKSLYLTGSFWDTYKFRDIVLKSKSRNDIFLINLNLDGETLGVTSFGGSASNSYPTLSFLPEQKKVVLAGTFHERLVNNDKFLVSKGQGDIFIGQIKDTLNVGPIARVSGRLYEDKNQDCMIGATEKGLANKLIKIEPGSQYVSSDEHGYYSFSVPYGRYIITPLLGPNTKSQLIKSCQERVPILADSLHKEARNVDFGYNILECAQLTVDIAADRRRRCFRSNTTVTYTNEGTADAQNVKIKVLYPKYVIPISSSLPWAAQLDSALVFNVGTVRAGERKSFIIVDSTICGNEGIRGLSQCVTAIISPKNSCAPPSHDWGHASVAVAGSFFNQEQTAVFSIMNEGEGDMTDSTSYRVFANAALVKKGKVKLKKGAFTTLEIPAQLATFRLEADQVPHHPGKSRPTVSLQPSTIPTSTQPVVTPIDAFYQDDADAETDISCLEIVDSYDPNDKQVGPKGITRRRYIKAEDELEYLIRFQNTGTDVAYKVVVQDIISEHLDISSLRVGSASHPFTYTVSGKGKPVLSFTFKDINLPDDKTDEPGSHGYIKFSIAQNPDNPKGTVIRNTAYNYFDYNSPIATNEVINIIGDTIIAPPAPFVVYDCSFEEPTVAEAGANISLCATNQAVLQANTPTKGIGRWRLISGQATIIDLNSPASGVQDIGFGETVLEWTVTLCERVSRSQVKINRYAVPPAPAVAALPLQCEGDALLPLVANGSNITWYKDATKQQKLFSGNNYIPVTTATTIFYATQTVNGCESPASAVVVNIHSKVIAVTASADTLIAPEADTYQWFFNDQPVNGGTNQKLLVKNTGLYRVKTITNGCMSNSENLMHIITLPKSELKIGPNPVRKEFVLELASNATGEVTVSIRDMLGKKVSGTVAQKTYTVLEQILSVASLAPGVYLVEVQLNNEVHKTKIVKL